VISEGGRRSVDLETFVVGCIKLKGAAKSADLMDLIYKSKKAYAEQRKALADMQNTVTKVDRRGGRFEPRFKL
jgi:hypothetical protein